MRKIFGVLFLTLLLSPLAFGQIVTEPCVSEAACTQIGISDSDWLQPYGFALLPQVSTSVCSWNSVPTATGGVGCLVSTDPNDNGNNVAEIYETYLTQSAIPANPWSPASFADVSVVSWTIARPFVRTPPVWALNEDIDACSEVGNAINYAQQFLDACGNSRADFSVNSIDLIAPATGFVGEIGVGPTPLVIDPSQYDLGYGRTVNGWSKTPGGPYVLTDLSFGCGELGLQAIYFSVTPATCTFSEITGYVTVQDNMAYCP